MKSNFTAAEVIAFANRYYKDLVDQPGHEATAEDLQEYFKDTPDSGSALDKQAFDLQVAAVCAHFRWSEPAPWVYPGDLVCEPEADAFFICGDDPKDVAEVRRRKGTYIKFDIKQIVRAHDILLAVILGEIDITITQTAKDSAGIAASVLCWILGHDHNSDFAENLARIERSAELNGYKLVKDGVHRTHKFTNK